MERRRLAVVLAGLVLVGGAVVALRLAGGTPDVNAVPPPPPLPTVIKPFSAQGALAPQPGSRPAAPRQLVVTPGPHRLRLAWGSALPGGHDPTGAVGYDVRWGSGSSLNHDILVAEPSAELDGLTPGANTRIEVRSVDSFGQRSAPATTTGRAQQNAPDGADNALVDHFDGAQVPDPRLWRLATVDNCAQADKGTGTDSGRMVILSECGQDSVSLRSRATLRLRPAGSATDGELGRFTIDTDSPGENGELDIDLVPGPAAMIAGSPNDPILPTPPGVAAVDGNLPPGTVRVRIAAAPDPNTNRPTDTVQVAAGPKPKLVARVTRRPQAVPQPRIGISVRWDVVLRTDGVQVLRDGVYVGGGNVVPGWTEATALVEFGGPVQDQQHEDVNMIGFGGAPTSAPPSAAAPPVVPGSFVDVQPGAAAKAVTSTDTGPGSALLRITAVAKPNSPDAPVTVHGVPPKFVVRVDGNRTFAAVPAVPGTPLVAQVRYPLVARIPADLLAGGRRLTAELIVDASASYPVEVDMVQADLDVTPGPDTGSARGSATSAVAQVPLELAVLSARVLDASGAPPAPGQPLPRGRAVLDITMDGRTDQRTTGQLAGLAGFEVWLDNVELVAVPTAVDGPGLAGDWQVAFSTGGEPAGEHSIDIRAYGAQRGVVFAETFATFQLR